MAGVEIAYPQGSDDYAIEKASVEIAYPQGSDDCAVGVCDDQPNAS